MPNKPLTIIQVLPALNGGGVEKGTLEIGHYLAQHGHRSIVVSAGGRMVEQLIAEGSEHIRADIGAKKLSTLRYIFWFRKLLQEIQPDIIHFRSRLPAWIGYLAWKSLSKSSRPRLVTTFHGQHSVNRYSAIMASGERVITVSEFMRNYILKSYPAVDPDKITVIYRGVDTNIYRPSFKPDSLWLGQWYKDFPQTKNVPLLTLPGRLTRRKGIEDFIKIIAELRQSEYAVHGLIVGDAHPKQAHYRIELEHLIDKLGLTDAISFTGHRTDLQNIIALSKTVLSLSKEPEAFGRTALEALSLGVPVVGYGHGGVAEQLDALYPEGNVAVGDIRQASQKIQQLLISAPPVIKPNLSFTLENMCATTLATYQQLVNNRESNTSA
ncbi:MAG: glycosyltransferase [Gammaproteobacteria bacterium]